jgi:RNA polymerase sigma-70 factor, ECF subfamily
LRKRIVNTLKSFEERLIAEIPALRRYGRVLCRDQESAEDLLQDSVERALRRRHLWRRPGNFRAWLFRIMHNIHANDMRWRARRPQAVVFEESHGGAQGPTQEMRAEIGEALTAYEQLSDDQRQLVVLIVIEGFSYREAARILSLPEGTVMSRMSRAREQLLDVMSDRARERVRRIK